MHYAADGSEVDFKADGSLIGRVFRDKDGEELARTEITKHTLTYNQAGFIKKEMYKDAFNQPISNPKNGGFGMEPVRNQAGVVTQSFRLDARGERQSSTGMPAGREFAVSELEICYR